jgi:hypothetical protein
MAYVSCFLLPFPQKIGLIYIFKKIVIGEFAFVMLSPIFAI